METITNETERTSRLGRRAAAVMAAIVGVSLTVGTSAFAVDPTLPADPSGGAYSSAWGTFQTWAISIGVPALFGLTVLGVGIRMLLKWTKRAGRAI